jgi:hypothetical protein
MAFRRTLQFWNDLADLLLSEKRRTGNDSEPWRLDDIEATGTLASWGHLRKPRRASRSQANETRGFD